MPTFLNTMILSRFNRNSQVHSYPQTWPFHHSQRSSRFPPCWHLVISSLSPLEARYTFLQAFITPVPAQTSHKPVPLALHSTIVPDFHWNAMMPWHHDANALQNLGIGSKTSAFAEGHVTMPPRFFGTLPKPRHWNRGTLWLSEVLWEASQFPSTLTRRIS